MEEYGVRYDSDGRYFVVVKWDDPAKPITGSVVFKAYRESEARAWIKNKLAGIPQIADI